MKKLNCMIVFCFFSCVSKIFSCNVSIPEIKVPVSLNNTEPSFILLGMFNQRVCEQFGMKSNPTDPFCRVTCDVQPAQIIRQMPGIATMKDVQLSRKLAEKCQALYAVPFKFVTESYTKDESDEKLGICFKNNDDTISSSIVQVDGNSYKVVLTLSDVNNHPNPEELLEDFKLSRTRWLFGLLSLCSAAVGIIYLFYLSNNPC